MIRPQNASTESSDDSNFMFLTMITILALTLYIFRPMGRRRQLTNNDKPTSSGEVGAIAIDHYIWSIEKKSKQTNQRNFLYFRMIALDHHRLLLLYIDLVQRMWFFKSLFLGLFFRITRFYFTICYFWFLFYFYFCTFLVDFELTHGLSVFRGNTKVKSIL